MARLTYNNTHNSDLFYAVKVEVSDPFFFIEVDEKSYVFLDHREYKVFKEENKNPQIEVVLLNPVMEEAAKLKDNTSFSNKVALYLCQKYGLVDKEIQVPISFPLNMADFLRSKDIKLIPTSPFCPQRLVKTTEEVAAIQDSLERTHHAFRRIEQILRDSQVEDDTIQYQGKILTSEFLKQEVELVLVQHDMMSIEGIIISCGADAAIPHHRGHGSLYPNQTIVCDIFPKNKTTGYFADMTRTYVKGVPSPKVERMYEAVKAAQDAAVQAAKPGSKGKDVHEAAAKVLHKHGFDVGDKGFIHGLGHGLGLDVHEEPYARAGSEDVLEPGNIISNEPGLYYPEHGGIRLEDIIHITPEGAENLTNYERNLVIQ